MKHDTPPRSQLFAHWSTYTYVQHHKTFIVSVWWRGEFAAGPHLAPPRHDRHDGDDNGNDADATNDGDKGRGDCVGVFYVKGWPSQFFVIA